MSGQSATPAPLRYRYLGEPGSASDSEAATRRSQVPSCSASNNIFGPLDLVVCDELALLIAAARDAAWQSHCNVIGAAYQDRKESQARLRGALLGYDRARGVL